MCLRYVTKNYIDEQDRNFGIGYKKFNLSNGQLYPTDQGKMTVAYELNKWIKADDNGILGSDCDYKSYACGFHIFTTEIAANKYRDFNKSLVTKQVRYRDVVVLGKQAVGSGTFKCIVAREMYIEE